MLSFFFFCIQMVANHTKHSVYNVAEDKNGKSWCMCMFCHRWAHDEYAGLDSDDDEYACTFCR